MNKKVLVVDDDADMLRLMELTIGEDYRYDLILAKDGDSAVEIALSEKPALIFLDVLMPGLDGIEVCRKLKASPETKGTKIFMLTALAQDFDRKRAEEAGADGYFTKPFSALALVEKLDEVIDN